MELNGVTLDPILVARIQQWMGEMVEIQAMYDAIDDADDRIGHYAQSYYRADERASFANEDAGEILSWLLTQLGLWPERQGAPDEADPTPGG
jgi:hypothetical protein